MNSKERVYAAMQKKAVDRIPIFMWYHPATVQKLSQFLEIAPKYFDQLIRNDVKQTWIGNNFAMEGITHDNNDEGHTDEWVIEWVKQGLFNQIHKSPLENVSEEEILNYKFPVRHIDQLLKSMDRIIPFSKDYFIGGDFSPCFLELMFRIRGMEHTFFDLLAARDITNELFSQGIMWVVSNPCNSRFDRN